MRPACHRTLGPAGAVQQMTHSRETITLARKRAVNLQSTIVCPAAVAVDLRSAVEVPQHCRLIDHVDRLPFLCENL